MTTTMRMGLAVILLGLGGCASSSVVLPYSQGMQAPGDTFGKIGGPIGRYVVWANHPDAEAEIVQNLLHARHVVVERAQIERVFAEQRFSLLHASDADVLQVGRLIGATDIIFADVTIDKQWHAPYGQRPTVRVRGVSIQTGQVRWSGMAAFPVHVMGAEGVVSGLTWLAISRAICRAEDWTEFAVGQTAHCNTNRPYYSVTAPRMH